MLDAYSYSQIYFMTVIEVTFLYLFISGGAFLFVNSLKKKKHPLLLSAAPFDQDSLRREFLSSLFSILLFGFSGVLLVALSRNGIVQFHEVTSYPLLFLEVVILLLWNEVHFFAVHRLFHTRFLYRFHRHHHLESNVSPLSTFSFHWTETVALGSVIPLALTWGSFSFEALLLFVLASLGLNTLGHSGVAIFKNGPSFLQLSQKHFDHHKYHKVNYGFVLSIFDVLFQSTKEQVLKSRLKQLALLPFVFFALTQESEARPQVTLWLTNGPKSEFNFSYSKDALIQIKNVLPISDNANSDGNANSNPSLDARLRCSGVAYLNGFMRSYKKKDIQFRLYYSDRNAEELKLSFADPSTVCKFTVGDKTVHIKPESLLHPAVNKLRSLPQTASQESGPAVLLKDPYQALNARFRVLLGYDLTYLEYLTKNPAMPLDFSRAPHLDLIVFDTLQLMNDFAGRLMLRVLSFHAKRGTRVTMISSKALLLPQEKLLFAKFRAENPEIQFELYETEGSLLHPIQKINSLHRNSHIKALITYSESNPQLNAMIAGGRNQSEMYFYPQKPDNSAYPDIIQWGNSWYQWGYFDDLDFMVGDGPLLRNIARDLLRYNESEFDIFKSNKFSPYLISYPFKEGKGHLEDAYLDLFNKAKKCLLIVSPYLNFSKDIEKAFDDAKARGVKVQFLTNLSVENDFMPFVLQPAMYKEFRKIMKKHEVIFYRKPQSTFHIKAILVDHESLVLGSVNLNRRSFTHDTELSVLFKDKQLIVDFESLLAKDIQPYLKTVELPELPPKSLTELVLGPFMGFM